MTAIRTMTGSDLQLGMKLKRQAGWNQTEADWRRFLELSPQGCFVAEVDGQPVGTAGTFVFGKVAWIAMVLVDPAARGKGVGTSLMRHALDHLDALGVTSIRLDATHLGKPIYEKLGFVSQFELARFEGSPVGSRHATPVEAMTGSQLEQAAALDAAVTATPRAKLLRALHRDNLGDWRMLRQGESLLGFLAARPGENAIQIGPCIAEAAAGEALLADAWRRYAGRRVFADIPLDHAPAVASALAGGLTEQRRFTRMVRGGNVCEDVSRLWTSSGPEKG